VLDEQPVGQRAGSRDIEVHRGGASGVKRVVNMISLT
jgi:hypothetical protein